MGRRQAWATGAMLLTMACGGSDTPPPETPAQDATAAMTAAMQQMQGALDAAARTATSDLPLVSAETLQDRLPTEVDGMARVTGDGYERTVTIEGNRGFESERRTPDGADRELSVIVGNRLLVQLDASNVDMAVLRRTLDRLRVSSLLSAP